MLKMEEKPKGIREKNTETHFWRKDKNRKQIRLPRQKMKVTS